MTADPPPVCDCDWPATIPEVPHRPWCITITGVHAEPDVRERVFAEGASAAAWARRFLTGDES